MKELLLCGGGFKPQFRIRSQLIGDYTFKGDGIWAGYTSWVCRTNEELASRIDRIPYYNNDKQNYLDHLRRYQHDTGVGSASIIWGTTKYFLAGPITVTTEFGKSYTITQMDNYAPDILEFGEHIDEWMGIRLSIEPSGYLDPMEVDLS